MNIFKSSILIGTFAIFSCNIFAYEMQSSEYTYIEKIQSDYKEKSFLQEYEVANLSKTVSYLQRTYEEKINYLEIELKKSKDRYVEKSLSSEKYQDYLKDKYENEILTLKKELVAKTRSTFEYQRMIEKLNPSEDTKKLIILNTDLAADLRKSEGRLAVFTQEFDKTNKNTNEAKRMPASVGK